MGSVETRHVCDDLEVLVIGRGSRRVSCEPIGRVELEVDVAEPVLEAGVNRDRVAGIDVEGEVVLVVGACDTGEDPIDGQRTSGAERVVASAASSGGHIGLVIVSW